MSAAHPKSDSRLLESLCFGIFVYCFAVRLLYCSVLLDDTFFDNIRSPTNTKLEKRKNVNCSIWYFIRYLPLDNILDIIVLHTAKGS